MFGWTFNDIKNLFLHSETLLWSRMQIAAGIIWTVLSVTDMSPLITNPKWFAIWGIVNGVVGEYLRRRGTDTVMVPVQEVPDGPVETVTMLTNKPVAKVN